MEKGWYLQERGSEKESGEESGVGGDGDGGGCRRR